MQMITTWQATLTGKIEFMQLDISVIQQDIDRFHTRPTEAERCMGDTEDPLQECAASLHTLQTKMMTLEARAEDTE